MDEHSAPGEPTGDATTTTATGPPQPPPVPPVPRPRLERSRTDRKIAGVAGGLGRYLGVDPLVIRVVLVALAIFGGSGLLLYGLGWLLVPYEGEQESEGQALLGGRGHAVAVVAIVISLVGLVGFGRSFRGDFGFGAVSALIVVGVAVYLLRRSERPAASPPAPAPHGPAPTAPVPADEWGRTEGVAYSAPPTTGPPPPYAGAPPYAGPPPHAGAPPYALPPRAPRPRPFLGPVTFFAVLLTAGLLVGWNVATDSDLTAVAVLACCLAVTGAGLLVGAYAGRARGLIVLGVALAVATAATAALSDVSVRGGVGDRTWAPRTAAEVSPTYRLGAGEGVLDLSRIEPPSDRPLRVRVRQGVGDLQVILPATAPVSVDAHVDLGDLRTPDRHIDGADLRLQYGEPDPGPGVLVVDAELDLGELEVRRASS